MVWAANTLSIGAFYVGRSWSQRGNVARYNYFVDVKVRPRLSTFIHAVIVVGGHASVCSHCTVHPCTCHGVCAWMDA